MGYIYWTTKNYQFYFVYDPMIWEFSFGKYHLKLGIFEIYSMHNPLWFWIKK